MGPVVRFETSVLSSIAGAAAAAHPNEACGALLGLDGPLPRITVAMPVGNSESGSPRDRFEVAPRDYLAVEAEAQRCGLVLHGFWHSHPDGEAWPSTTDRAYAWEGLLTVIVAVPAGRTRDIRAWDPGGAGAPFAPVGIVAGDDARPVEDLLEFVTRQGGPR